MDDDDDEDDGWMDDDGWTRRQLADWLPLFSPSQM